MNTKGYCVSTIGCIKTISHCYLTVQSWDVTMECIKDTVSLYGDIIWHYYVTREQCKVTVGHCYSVEVTMMT